jgi:hypothetical protein
MVIRSIQPLAALTAPQHAHLSELIESLAANGSDLDPPVADWQAQALVVYEVFETDAGCERSRRLVVAPASDVLAPGDAVVAHGWTAVMNVATIRRGLPVEAVDPALHVAARLVREAA